MHLITIPHLVALLVLFVICLSVALAVEAMIDRWAVRMPEASNIEPEDFKGVDVSVSAAVELSNLGFDVKAWGSSFIQITDPEGITFYMPKDATLQQCLDRYQEKVERFRAA